MLTREATKIAVYERQFLTSAILQDANVHLGQIERGTVDIADRIERARDDLRWASASLSEISTQTDEQFAELGVTDIPDLRSLLQKLDSVHGDQSSRSLTFLNPLLASGDNNHRVWAASVGAQDGGLQSDGTLDLDTAGLANDLFYLLEAAEADAGAESPLDRVNLGQGDDVAVIHELSGEINGGSGVDAISYASFDGVTVTASQEAGDGSLVVTGNPGTLSRVANGNSQRVENVETILGSAGSDEFIGGAKPHVFIGQGGGDIYRLRAGDSAVLGSGADEVHLSTRDIVWLVRDGVATGEVYDEAKYTYPTEVRYSNVNGRQGAVWYKYATPKYNIFGLGADDKLYVDGQLITGASVNMRTWYEPVEGEEPEVRWDHTIQSSWLEYAASESAFGDNLSLGAAITPYGGESLGEMEGSSKTKQNGVLSGHFSHEIYHIDQNGGYGTISLRAEDSRRQDYAYNSGVPWSIVTDARGAEINLFGGSEAGGGIQYFEQGVAIDDTWKPERANGLYWAGLVEGTEIDAGGDIDDDALADRAIDVPLESALPDKLVLSASIVSGNLDLLANDVIFDPEDARITQFAYESWTGETPVIRGPVSAHVSSEGSFRASIDTNDPDFLSLGAGEKAAYTFHYAWNHLDPSLFDFESFVTVEIQGTNETPIAIGQSLTTSSAGLLLASLNIADQDKSDILFVSIVAGPTNGTLQVEEETGRFRYLASDPTLGDSFQYTVRDQHGAEASATVIISASTRTLGLPVFGDNGANFINGGVGDDQISGGAGDDRLMGRGGDDILIGGDGNDAIFGGDGNDHLMGSNGNDQLRGEAGADLMEGGDGDDRYFVDNVNDTVVEFASGGLDVVVAQIDVRLSEHVENLVLQGSGSIGYGNALNNHIQGNVNIGSRLYGGLGNDRLVGGAEDDLLSGGEGEDLLFGGGGSDRLLGGSGNDTLRGESGSDVLEGGLGDDIYFVDDTGDYIQEDENAGLDTVYASVDFVLTANVEQLHLRGSAVRAIGNAGDNLLAGQDAGNDFLDGAAGNDRLLGFDGSDELVGGAGNDDLVGGLGADIMRGEEGDDQYWVDDASDLVIEAAGEGLDTVHASIDHTLGSHVEQLFLQGAASIGVGNSQANLLRGREGGADHLDGGSGDDELRGLSGNDTLVGGAGYDTLVGGKGDDLLFGGADDDVYVYRVGDGDDRVEDFEGYDALQFGRGINLDDLIVTADGDDLKIRLAIGGSVTVTRGMLEESTVREVWFGNRSSISIEELRDAAGAANLSGSGGMLLSASLDEDDIHIRDGMTLGKQQIREAKLRLEEHEDGSSLPERSVILQSALGEETMLEAWDRMTARTLSTRDASTYIRTGVGRRMLEEMAPSLQPAFLDMNTTRGLSGNQTSGRWALEPMQGKVRTPDLDAFAKQLVEASAAFVTDTGAFEGGIAEREQARLHPLTWGVRHQD